jgi:hypothetical protein
MLGGAGDSVDEVEVHDAEVRLTGHVDSDALKELAETVAGTVNGVRKVKNALRLTPGHRSQSGAKRVGTGGGGRAQPRTGRGITG